MKKREKANLRIVNQLVPGTKVRAIYADEENDPSWYDAVIDSVEVGVASVVPGRTCTDGFCFLGGWGLSWTSLVGFCFHHNL